MPIATPVHAHHRQQFAGLGYRVPLDNGERGTAQTIKVMRQLVDQALSDSSFVRKAVDIVRPVPAYNELAELNRIYSWVKSNIRFVKDPVSKEKLMPLTELLKSRAEDCDGHALLTAGLATAVGYPARWITISTDPSNPAEFTHIWTEAEMPPGSSTWIPLDTARADSQFGVEPPMYFRKRAWSVTEDHYEDLSGHRISFRRPMKPKFLSGYSTLGQDGGWSDINWQPVLQQTIAEIPPIIAATSGHGTATSPYATYSSPYSSFATPYTPGYGVPAAGYTTPAAPTFGGISLGGNTLMWIVGGLLIWSLARSKR